MTVYIQIFIITQKGKICLIPNNTIVHMTGELYLACKTTRLQGHVLLLCTFIMFEQTFISSSAIVNIILKLFTSGLTGTV